VRQKTGERETCLNRRGDHGDDGDEDGGNDIHDGEDEVHLQHVSSNYFIIHEYVVLLNNELTGMSMSILMHVLLSI
jgi:hypothetical protein